MSYANAVKLLRLAIAASGRVGVTLSDIEEMFECNRRSAQRMTVALTDVFVNTDRWVDDEQFAHWRLPSESVVAFLTPTPEELAVLARAIDKLRNDGAANEADALKRLEEKVLAAIPRSLRARIEVDEEALLQALGLAARPGPRPVVEPDVEHQIATALKARHAIDILYKGWRDTEPRWRKLGPHGLLLGTRRYLVAQDLERRDNRPRHYRVEDILEVRESDENFVWIEDFDIANHARGGFSSYVNEEEIEDIVWKFSPEAAHRAQRFVFHPDQTTRTEPDGSLVISFRACGLLEMCWHLYAWGDKVEVLAPEALRAMVAGHRRSDFESLP